MEEDISLITQASICHPLEVTPPLCRGHGENHCRSKHFTFLPSFRGPSAEDPKRPCILLHSLSERLFFVPQLALVINPLSRAHIGFLSQIIRNFLLKPSPMYTIVASRSFVSI